MFYSTGYAEKKCNNMLLTVFSAFLHIKSRKTECRLTHLPQWWKKKCIFSEFPLMQTAVNVGKVFYLLNHWNNWCKSQNSGM